MKTVRLFLFSVMCLAPAFPLLGNVPDWENEDVTGIKKEKRNKRTVFISE